MPLELLTNAKREKKVFLNSKAKHTFEFFFVFFSDKIEFGEEQQKKRVRIFYASRGKEFPFFLKKKEENFDKFIHCDVMTFYAPIELIIFSAAVPASEINRHR